MFRDKTHNPNVVAFIFLCLPLFFFGFVFLVLFCVDYGFFFFFFCSFLHSSRIWGNDKNEELRWDVSNFRLDAAEHPRRPCGGCLTGRTTRGVRTDDEDEDDANTDDKECCSTIADMADNNTKSVSSSSAIVLLESSTVAVAVLFLRFRIPPWMVWRKSVSGFELSVVLMDFMSMMAAMVAAIESGEPSSSLLRVEGIEYVLLLLLLLLLPSWCWCFPPSSLSSKCTCLTTPAATAAAIPLRFLVRGCLILLLIPIAFGGLVVVVIVSVTIVILVRNKYWILLRVNWGTVLLTAITVRFQLLWLLFCLWPLNRRTLLLLLLLFANDSSTIRRAPLLLVDYRTVRFFLKK